MVTQHDCRELDSVAVAEPNAMDAGMSHATKALHFIEVQLPQGKRGTAKGGAASKPWLIRWGSDASFTILPVSWHFA